MSFAVCRMQKMKSFDLKGIQFHNQRERESKTNPDIENDKSHLNYDFVNDENIDYNEGSVAKLKIRKCNAFH